MNIFEKRGKPGQFYLMGAFIIIMLILGYVGMFNLLRKKDFTKLDYAGEELEIESKKVLDYVAYNNLNNTQKKNILINFTKLYSNYTLAQNLYFVFGNKTEAVVSAYRKSSPGIMIINYSSNSEEVEINKQEYINKSYSPNNYINLTINNIAHKFKLKSGENFYFILSKGDEEQGEYFFTGSVVKDEKN